MHSRTARFPRVSRAAFATVAAFAMAGSLPAQAQFVSTGANISYPVNLFPIDPAATTLDFGLNTVSIGNGGVGDFSALSGALLKAGSLTLGNAGTGSGTVLIDGIGTSALLAGFGNRIEVGNWGSGSLTVSAGAVVDATVDAAGCSAPGAFCNNFIGNGAGSTGNLTITGAGSQVSTLRSFIVGATAVFTVAADGFDFGTPGGATHASANVLAGGTLRTQNASVGQVVVHPASLGTETATASVVIDGAGSRWIATRNTVDNTSAFLGVGNGARSDGSITVSNRGQLIVDGTGGSSSSFDAMNIGINGGKGHVTVTGAGSSIQVTGNNTIIQVGRSGVGATGALDVLAGATASTRSMNVGRDLAAGTVHVDGAGSRLDLIGVGTPGTSGAAFLNIGQDGGSGSATVSNGGRLFISDGGGDSRPAGGSPGIALGRGVGSTGLLTITGAGSVVEIVSTSLGVPVGSADNINPFVGVGYDNPGTTSGQLVVSNGGQLLLTGNAVSNPTFGHATSLEIGGRGGAGVAGTGSATVTGAGSRIVLSGYDTYIGVGRTAGSNGTLNILDHGYVATTSLVAGHAANGTITLDNGQLALSGYRTDSSTTGAGMTVGRAAGGVGVMTMTHGALITIENNTLAGGMSIGGDSFFSGGTGSVSMSGGSSIQFSGSVTGGSLTVGRSGTGSLVLDGASSVDVGNTRTVFVGRDPAGTGTLTVLGGSTISGGTFNIGGNGDTDAGGTGTATITGPGSRLQATGDSAFVAVGRSATGNLVVSNLATLEATVLNVGRAIGGAGTMVVNNATLALSGQRPDGIGAGFTVGNRGGTGTATISNGSHVAITNLGSGGASLNVGGTPINPLGTGTLVVSGSQITLTAAPGLATARIGHDGTGTAILTGSTLDVGDGAVHIAALPGSTGTMVLSAGSVVTAGYVGVGATPAGAGGSGHLIVNDSTVNTGTFEIGAGGILSGNGGTIHATGDVIVGGTISPGNSPGRLIINCNIISLDGSLLILDIAGVGEGFAVDNLVIGNGSTFDLHHMNIVFNFLGDTDPTAFAASGGFDLDNFLRSGLPGGDVGLSTAFAPGETWSDVVDPTKISAVSSVFDVTELKLQGDGSFVVTTAPIPEPSTWAMLITGLLLFGGWARRRNAGALRAPLRHPLAE